MAKTFTVVDGHNLVYKAYYALKDRPLTTSKGENVSAPYVFVRMLRKVLEDFKPDYAAVVFDTGKKTFRNQLYSDYKANRPPMPQDLRNQIEAIKEIARAMGLQVVMRGGYEADDVIGALAKRFAASDTKIKIISNDKDINQLVSDDVKIYSITRGLNDIEEITPETVTKKYGVSQEKLIDLFALMGDSSDNIPGVSGIGQKTALRLLKQFGSLEGIYENLDKIESPKLKEKLLRGKDNAYLSRELFSIKTDIELEQRLADFEISEPDTDKLSKLFTRFEFKEFLKELGGVDEKEPEHRFILIKTLEELDMMLDTVKKAGIIGIALLPWGDDSYIHSQPAGIAVSVYPQAYFVPLIKAPDIKLDVEQAVERMREMLQSPKVKKVGHCLKKDWVMAANRDIRLNGIDFDAELAAYTIDPTRSNYGLETLALNYLKRNVSLPTVVYPISNGLYNLADSLENYHRVICQRALLALMLKEPLMAELEAQGLSELYRKVELLLIEVLGTMERGGIKLNSTVLSKLSSSLGSELKEIAEAVYELAGERFNLNSPKQLANILFDKLSFSTKGIKRTKSGFSTNEESLLMLISNEPDRKQLPELILRHRNLSKLKSTYVEGLLKAVNPITGKVHTQFNQTVASTGRLSSSNPNLQNIPIRDEFGKQIRKAFIPDNDGDLILSADYSQIELRILAEIADEEAMKQAFREGKDIHAQTASLLFDCKLEDVTQDMRRVAKTVNFGIDYGMGEYGLAQRLGISNPKARRFIETYFKRFPNIKKYIDRTIKLAKEQGYVTTLMGRRGYLHQINAPSAPVRQAEQRRAINFPIQGTAAEMIKKAMIDIHQRMRKQGFKSRMVLQIHDELIFNIVPGELDGMIELVREEMIGALKLSMPIVVNISYGKSWYEAH